MDRAITASDANQRFSELLRDVAAGESFTVLSRGRAVARVVPIDKADQQKSVAGLLTLLRAQPMRHYEGWTRDNLYE